MEKKEREKAKAKANGAWTAAVEPVTKKATAEKSVTKRSRDEGEEEDASPASKKVKVATPPKKEAVEESGTKRARDDVDEEDVPAAKKAKAAAPIEMASSDATSSEAAPTTGSDASAATPDGVPSPPRKKGVARSDVKAKKAKATRGKKNAKDQLDRDNEAAERAAIVKAGGTAVRTENLLKM